MHMGIIAIKLMVDHDGGLTGQACTLWSNSRLAVAAVKILNGATIKDSVQPLKVARSREVFKFAAPGPGVSRPRYAIQCWNPESSKVEKTDSNIRI